MRCFQTASREEGRQSQANDDESCDVGFAVFNAHFV
jgi:hypothetical protein